MKVIVQNVRIGEVRVDEMAPYLNRVIHLQFDQWVAGPLALKIRNDQNNPLYQEVRCPRPWGYSCAGEVLAVAVGAKHEFQVGDRVVCAELAS